MGILNVTPDSFSDGGAFFTPATALTQARRMVAEGADWIDIGGESTRPGAAPVSVQEELDRVMPVLHAVRSELPVRISVDTSKPEVMRAVIAAGADLINDVCALTAPGALDVLAEAPQTAVCLMHMQGEPRTMQHAPHYHDVVTEVSDFLAARVAACEQADICRARLYLDPGFGFGKTLAHNLSLLKHLGQLCEPGCRLLIGVSRKSMIGAILDRPVDQRLYGGLAMAAYAVLHGVAILRTHDVAATVDVVKTLAAVRNAA